jgi:hypothetical protein
MLKKKKIASPPLQQAHQSNIENEMKYLCACLQCPVFSNFHSITFISLHLKMFTKGGIDMTKLHINVEIPN